jgi:aryl-alcohol dehydrogenase-like predicted oxidoreductase
MGAEANREVLSRRWLHQALDDSLRRLGVDHVDLYQCHAWDPLTPISETLGALDDLVTAGKVRYVGVSNFAGWQLQRAVLVARYEGRAPVATLQPQYNLLARDIELELVPLCLDEGVGILPWSPLGGGWLTGKYDRDEGPKGATRLGEDPERGVEAWARRNTDRTWQIVDAVRETAAACGVSPAQVALRWVTDRPGVSSTILGARTLDQLRDNLAAVELVLDEAQTARLDEVSAPATPLYPYGWAADLDAQRRERAQRSRARTDG